MTAAEIPDGYYAVPDPCNPDVLTLWHVTDGAIKASPPRALHGPVLYKRDVPKGLSKLGRATWVSEWFQQVRTPWDEQIRAALAADPETAGALYAKTAIRCRNCNLPLTDPISKAAGRGPDCRKQAAAWAPAKRAAAEHETTPNRNAEETT